MPRKKLKKIQEVDSLPNVFYQPDPGWLQRFFGNDNPLTLEIGCGRGDYSLALAVRYPWRNFVGVDVKGARLWTGARRAIVLGVENVAFLRASALALPDFIPAASVDEIWIPFPDPFPKKRKARRRLTAPEFLQVYGQLLQPQGRVHVKTDDRGFYEFTLETIKRRGLPVLQVDDDVYQAGLQESVLAIQTKYEKNHIAEGRTIKYVCFGFD